MKYYIAYGSNLNEEQMKFRCPTATRVGFMYLDGYELEFRLYLTIVPKKGSKVPCGVWKIKKEDEENLDRYEGYPTYYYKKKMILQIDDEYVDGIVYIMNDIRDPLPPTSRYLNTCLKGYEDFNFPKEYLLDAYNKVCKMWKK